MRQLRGSGFRFSDATFRSMWGEIEHARSLRGNIADVNLNRRPPADLESEISGGRAGTRLYRFDIFVRRRGEREVMQSHIGVKSNRSITFRTAMQQIMDNFADNEDLYDSELVGVVPAAVNIFTG